MRNLTNRFCNLLFYGYFNCCAFYGETVIAIFSNLLTSAQVCLSHCKDYNSEEVAGEKLKPTKDDWNHGTLLILEELLRASNLSIEVTPRLFSYVH